MNGNLGEVVDDAPVTVLDVLPSARPLPEAVRASLEAIKVAQLAARERARRDTWQARAVVVGVAAAVVIGGLVVLPRVRTGRAANAATAATIPKRAPAAIEKAPPVAVPASGGALAATVAELPAAKESSPVAAPGAALSDACRDSYQGKRWRAAAAACTTAFNAHPDDASLALRVAEAEYARDHLDEARGWARRTLALDAKQVDGLAILGLSEQRAGHGEAAARAFRRYLTLAPRGWHATEARAALRGSHASARPAVTASSAGQARPGDADAAVQPPPVTEPAPTAPAALSLPAAAPGDAP
ncbi:MAG TPA: hypothetical protein VGP07_21525 [Polyangia bacterium]|jgi:hypothetical protein